MSTSHRCKSRISMHCVFCESAFKCSQAVLAASKTARGCLLSIFDLQAASGHIHIWTSRSCMWASFFITSVSWLYCCSWLCPPSCTTLILLLQTHVCVLSKVDFKTRVALEYLLCSFKPFFVNILPIPECKIKSGPGTVVGFFNHWMETKISICVCSILKIKILTTKITFHLFAYLFLF